MNEYRKAMFSAYTYPVIIFFLFPNVVFLAISDKTSFADFLRLFLPFLVALFGAGYVLAPKFGPKVLANKFLSFAMAGICLLFGSTAYVLGLMIPNFDEFPFGFYLMGLFVLVNFFPAALGGFLFIGACEGIAESLARRHD